jgi:hypothetical protein
MPQFFSYVQYKQFTFKNFFDFYKIILFILLFSLVAHQFDFIPPKDQNVCE